MIKIGVIGCGHWGPNHIRVFNQLPDSRVLMCADVGRERLKAIKHLFPSVLGVSDYREILAHSDIDAVCIATPTDSHYALVKEALNHDKHVLCEKPLALKVDECQELQALADTRRKIVMVGHVFIFNSGISHLKKYLQDGELGTVYYAHSQRTNLGPFRYDVNAMWDLAPHDISIFNYLFGGCPVNVSARGQKCLGPSLDDLAFVTLEYPRHLLVHIHVSWLDPRKVRQITVVGDKKMVMWDDLDSVGPIRLYDKHVQRTATFYETYGEFQLLSREGSITIPKVVSTEPLKAQNQYFLECLKENKSPALADASKGLEVVKTLCAIQESMDKRGVLTAVR